MKYQIILADPPWRYNFSETESRSIESKYPTMSLDELCSLDIASISASDSVLFLWVTFPKLDWLFPLLTAWGFEYKTVAFVWVKTNKKTNPEQTMLVPQDCFDSFTGMGYYTRSNAEICVLATRGKPFTRLVHNISQIVYYPIAEHSRKPEIVKENIVKLFGPLSRIELFARNKTEGWDCTGNDVSDEDIRVSLQKIASK